MVTTEIMNDYSKPKVTWIVYSTMHKNDRIMLLCILHYSECSVIMQSIAEYKMFSKDEMTLNCSLSSMTK